MKKQVVVKLLPISQVSLAEVNDMRFYVVSLDGEVDRGLVMRSGGSYNIHVPRYNFTNGNIWVRYSSSVHGTIQEYLSYLISLKFTVLQFDSLSEAANYMDKPWGEE